MMNCERGSRIPVGFERLDSLLRSASISSNSDMDALLEHQREARPAADREVETRKPAGAGSRRSCLLGPHPASAGSHRLRLGLRGVSSTPLLMLETCTTAQSMLSIMVCSLPIVASWSSRLLPAEYQTAFNPIASSAVARGRNRNSPYNGRIPRPFPGASGALQGRCRLGR